jgi:glycosyltransferase involved in cell wall biosynthesis
MKIMYIHQYFVTPDASGGIRSYELAKRLTAAGHEVTVVTSSAFLPESRHQNFAIDGIQVKVLKVEYSNRMPFRRRILAFLKFAFLASKATITQKPDLIYATSTPLTVIIPALTGKIFHRKPMIFEVRDLWPELPIAIGAIRNPFIKWVARMMEWLAYHSANHVIALSPGMAAGVQKRGIAAEKITVIPNGSNLNLFNIDVEAGNAVRERLDLQPDQALVVYTGTLGLVNNITFMIEVAAQVYKLDSSVNFLIVGDGSQREAVIKTAEQHSLLNKTVHVWPPVAKVELPTILAAATILTSFFLPIPELRNNSANKFFDALAAGKPIAINHAGWQAELLQKNNNGVVLSEDDAQIAARQLIDHLQDENWLAEAGRASQQLALTEFNYDLLADRVNRILTRWA